jgi:TetR/AcrR family transcriptional repressor of nem operon
MTDTASTTERIIAAAEQRMREGGFHGFSFREIAADVGIKSASVHHHFPTKDDLGGAVVRSYTDRFLESLGDPGDPGRSPDALKALYIDAFRQSFGEECRMCICGLLSTEASSTPPGVTAAVRDFFERNIAWIETVLARSAPEAGSDDVRIRALRIVGMLEGAMLLAHSLGDKAAFEAIVSALDADAFTL